MPDGDAVTVKITNRIAEVSAAEWDACAGDDNPFVSHGFLDVLEESGSADEGSGWLPQHLLVEDADGHLIGAVPCYLKNHSYGEYVFDWGWADAFQRAGGEYYPKLQVSVPFTPVTCRKLLIRPDADQIRTSEILAGGLIGVTDQHAVSSLHINFPPEDEAELLE
ncbi:MAG: GNAT family N-acetyltransferase, partial [Rhodospirillaceae bacterium]|nr:GNAT family N-acetyltransferase [Rhodospirillaceae bacterium]